MHRTLPGPSIAPCLMLHNPLQAGGRQTHARGIPAHSRLLLLLVSAIFYLSLYEKFYIRNKKVICRAESVKAEASR